MSKNLIPLSIEAPGFSGLNTQNSGSVLPPGWAIKLQNFVFDDIGRLASRKGTKHVNTTAISGTPEIKQIHEYITNTGASVIIASGGNAIWKIDPVANTATDISGTITTPTADNWQFANFNGWCVGYQEGHAPIILTTAAGSFVDATGTMYNGSMVLSAYGRTWTVVDNTLYYSDLLIHTYAGGSSGTFDLSKYWPNGMDQATALADFNGYLVVFGKESIIVYQNPDDPTTTMSIVEGISGIGCIARDSVQIIGNDIVFLSSTGVRTLGRVIQEKSMPIGDVSKHVRDAIIRQAIADSPENIRSAYNREEGFYIISFPSRSESYVFDLKFLNQDGTWKSTTWNYGASAFCYTQSLKLYLANVDGFVSEYFGYTDNAGSTGAGGASYECVYEGVWNDFGEEVASLLKIPKRASVLASGVSGGIIAFRWSLDYKNIWNEIQLSFQQLGDQSRYGVAQYAVDTYAGALEFERVNGNMNSAGQVVKLGLQATVTGTKFALQRIDILAKAGRIGI